MSGLSGRNVATLCLLLGLLSALPLQAQSRASLRFAHIDARAPRLDIVVNGTLAVADIAYGSVSVALGAPAGELELSLLRAGTSEELYVGALMLPAQAALVPIVSLAAAQLHVLPEQLGMLAPGQARVSLFNASDAAVALRLYQGEDDPIETALEPGKGGEPLVLAAQTATLSVASIRASGGSMSFQGSIPLAGGASHQLLVYGTETGLAVLPIATPLLGDADSGKLRFLHGIAGAASVDLLIDGQVVIPSMSFAQPSELLSLPAGSHDLAIVLGQAEIIAESLSVTAGEWSTMLLAATSRGLEMLRFRENLGALSDEVAVLQFINAIPDGFINLVQVEDGSLVAHNLAFAETSEAAAIAPGRQTMQLLLDIAGEVGTISVPARYYHGGSHYSLFVLAGGSFAPPQLLVLESAHGRALPGQEPPATATAIATELPTEAAPSTATSVTSDAIPTAIATAPFAATLPAMPHAVIAVDADSALHLRQYPSDQAMSLGLLPPQSEILVLGRRGPTVLQAGDISYLPVDLSGYEHDPAADLPPTSDLAAADTWLYVLYSTEDGGSLYGWVNALYLQVYDAAGERQRLASLATVKQNQAGNTYNTVARPPALSDSVSARVISLNPGILLNLRMENSPNAEVISQLAPGTELGFFGLDGSEDWAFIELVMDNGNILRGWVSTGYIDLLLHGSPITAATLRELDASALQRISGSMSGSITPAQAADSDDGMPLAGIVGEVNVDENSALHLRLYPDEESESLNLVPPGARLQISGMTNNRQWYRVSYRQETGWVAAAYVLLSLDGQRYARATLEIQLPRYTNQGT